MRYNHFDMLPEKAFRPVGKRMTLEGGGKGGSAPAAPDYTGAAIATAQGNVDAARATAAANRVNQYTPTGNLVYSQTPTTSLDTKAYNTALTNYQNELSKYNSLDCLLLV